MIKHTLTQEVNVLENPHLSGDGKRHTSLHCQYINAQGTQVTGIASVQSMLEAAGIKAQPGDKLTITIEMKEKQ